MEPSLRARIRGGDPDAFGLLFDADARAVYNLAFRLTGDWAAAEDAVSLTFLEAWRLRAGGYRRRAAAAVASRHRGERGQELVAS